MTYPLIKETITAGTLPDTADISNIFCCVVGFSRFRPDLKDMPYELKADLAVVYYESAETGEGGKIRLITNSCLKKMGISSDKLKEAAWDNTLKRKRAVMKALPDMTGSETPVPLYVLSNEEMYLGAVAIFYPMLLEMIAEELDEDICILPSSIHECLIMPVNDETDFAELRRIVKKVNDTEVSETEILSYNIYRFSRVRGVMSIDN
ncbi:MAG: hypothetical protein IKR00_00045 [Lachnospiraceae bacterium]|nr:hypothetical protein [Lachnospiraceae bacterium]